MRVGGVRGVDSCGPQWLEGQSSIQSKAKSGGAEASLGLPNKCKTKQPNSQDRMLSLKPGSAIGHSAMQIPFAKPGTTSRRASKPNGKLGRTDSGNKEARN